MPSNPSLPLLSHRLAHAAILCAHDPRDSHGAVSIESSVGARGFCTSAHRALMR